MTYQYSITASQFGFNYEPLVGVYLSNLTTGRSVRVWGLVDSGATATMVHPQIGQLLGIDVETGEPRNFIGVGGEITGHAHKIGLRLDGDDTAATIECAFAPITGEGVLLGQDGFFDYFQVSFEKYNGIFYVVRP